MIPHELDEHPAYPWTRRHEHQISYYFDGTFEVLYCTTCSREW
jgi:hypothetical protein